MDNQKKIADFLHNGLKLSRYELQEDGRIIISSSISNLQVLLDFVKPLNYYLFFSGGSIHVMHNN